MQWLLRRVGGGAGATDDAEPSDSALDSLLPPGHRSGKGTASIEPYLDQFRSTRPASLD